ncbi:MAG TPA: hypothetical protein PKI93_06310 [Alphaproteobacteria bacterium]|nr:hypothetical protein [Alphaproteobacteria bacterium]
MARVFSISKGENGYDCRVSTVEFEQNKGMVCNVASPVEAKLDNALSMSAPAATPV